MNDAGRITIDLIHEIYKFSSIVKQIVKQKILNKPKSVSTTRVISSLRFKFNKI